ncbi:diguanylate cyclase [Thermacetogenium phaeum DSM 12270]|uniref:Diguanylate cyclase n=2 Tax=Thermacetogenium phaeum TaxID=85874 RepID=K4LE26_THEPS|nr:CBS domain-containing protein [Thermacetogenium phaeum]AFV11123.1 diguanylate cyclase [Thermacetogenium phaeum DSM 12270]
MFSIRDIMTRSPLTIGPGESVERAAALMNQHRIGGLPVVEDGRLIGIITSRDVRTSHFNRLVADAMSKQVVVVSGECSLWEAKELLEQHGIERLPVVKDGRLVGIVTKSQLYAELGKRIDALTGLNRAEFLQWKASEFLQGGQEIAIIFLDLDDFGAIDKELGHVMGDRILQHAAQVLRSVMEDGIDYLCRYAGDEFAVVTLRPFEEAKKLALRMVTALIEENWPHGLKVTGSAGIAGGRRSCSRPEGDEACTVSDLINMASLASARAKKEKKAVIVAGRVELKEAG